MKMEKTPRYTQRERNMVLGFAAQYKDVIENKRTDAESNRKKDEVWRQIAKEFNCRVYHQRSSKQLRQLYKNMKLLLKKDLCGGSTGGGVGGGAASVVAQESKGNRSFMDILNALSQQDSVTQYITEQMSPSGYSSSRQQKYDDDFDDSKMPCGTYDGLDNDVIVIKSEDISDNEHSQNGVGDMDDDDEDDCLSTKDIPEVCLEEEDDEIFATDLRRQSVATQQQQALQISTTAQHQQQQQQRLQPDITIQNVGGIRVGSIGNIASITNAAKALQNSSSNNNSSSSNNNINNNSALNISLSSTGNNQRSPVSSTEQQQRDQQQQLLFRGLGLSAVHNVDQQQQQSQQQLPTLQHATQRATPNNITGSSNGLLALSSNYAHIKSSSNNHNYNNNNSGGGGGGGSQRNNDYLLSLDIEERKRKIDLLNAQIDYWKTLTKKLDANSGHNPTPSCLCHFPASAASSSSNKINGLHTQHSSSSS